MCSFFVKKGEENMDRKKAVEQLLQDYLERGEIKRIISALEELGFFEAPASTKYHGAYEGGLFDHSYAVTRELMRLTEDLDLKWERPESPIIVGIMHDLCKHDTYKFDKELNVFVYNTEADSRHGEKSAELAQLIIPLTEEERTCIRWHMGAYDQKENWGPLGQAIKEFHNVLWTHTADMVASQFLGI